MHMSRLPIVNPQTAEGQVKEQLEAVKKKLGFVPNLVKSLANSPAALASYVAVSGHLAHGQLHPVVREQLALVVGETNGCEYCVSAHSAAGKLYKLSTEELQANRRAESSDPKVDVLLKFAHAVLTNHGHVEDSDVSAVRAAGYSDAEIAEVITHVALNVLTNYFNNFNQTTLDFPAAPTLAHA
jgi:uncharacterized peroxidase-related enzyme